jgi:hypothetical protein
MQAKQEEPSLDTPRISSGRKPQESKILKTPEEVNEQVGRSSEKGFLPEGADYSP